MKKVAIDVRMLHHSGIGRYIRDVVPALVGEMPNVYFYLIGPQNTHDEFFGHSSGNFEIINCGSPIYSVAEQISLKRKIPRDVDVFWSPHYNIPVFYCGKLLVTVHDVFHLAMSDMLPLHQKIYSRLMFNALKNKADAVISVSSFSKEELIRFTDIPGDKIQVVHNGLRSFWLSQEKSKNPPAKPYLLYVGNVKPHKNIKRLLQAFKKIAQDFAHDLVIVGKKSGFITGESNLAQEYSGLEDRVHFTGLITDEELKYYYQNSTLFVFPSTYEGFGFPPLEAMASGAPVLAAGIGAVKEVCGDAVLYCDPYDADDISEKIQFMLKNTAARNQFVVEGWMKAQKYTREKCVHETRRVLERMLVLN